MKKKDIEGEGVSGLATHFFVSYTGNKRNERNEVIAMDLNELKEKQPDKLHQFLETRFIKKKMDTATASINLKIVKDLRGTLKIKCKNSQNSKYWFNLFKILAGN